MPPEDHHPIGDAAECYSDGSHRPLGCDDDTTTMVGHWAGFIDAENIASEYVVAVELVVAGTFDEACGYMTKLHAASKDGTEGLEETV